MGGGGWGIGGGGDGDGDGMPYKEWAGAKAVRRSSACVVQDSRCEYPPRVRMTNLVSHKISFWSVGETDQKWHSVIDTYITSSGEERNRTYIFHGLGRRLGMWLGSGTARECVRVRVWVRVWMSVGAWVCGWACVER